MEKRCHSRMMLGQFWLSMRTSVVAVTKPVRRRERKMQRFKSARSAPAFSEHACLGDHGRNLVDTHNSPLRPHAFGQTPRFVPKPAAYVQNLICRVNWTQIEHPALDFLELRVAVRLVEPSECRFDIGRLATILEPLTSAQRQ
jgi:hypothetical protein